ncbi:kinase-like domain-containing protein [Rhizophagus irregularis DAOM 181602=DAOM 197198]|nr:kinase-like domain-containing protein [Rhizophagus irregularis DAOM 181602=DAOM 197198]
MRLHRRTMFRYRLKLVPEHSEKSFVTLKEIVKELELQRHVDFHNNIIRFYGITKHESSTENIFNPTKNYLLTWNNKYNLAYWLACSVLCLHEEGIIQRDLHSCSVLIHQDFIKLADFGLSKRIDEASKSQSKLFGMVPYIDPKWKTPFHEEKYDFSLMYKISQGRRETTVPNTPNDYSNLYTECWNNEPSKQPAMHEVVNKLSIFISNSDNITIYQQNDIVSVPVPNEKNTTPNSTGNSLHGELFNMNISEVDRIFTNERINENITSEINEIVDFIFEEVNKGHMKVKRNVLDYLDNHIINSKEIYNRL